MQKHISTSTITKDNWTCKSNSVLKGPLPSEGEVQTTFKANEKFTCAMYGRQKLTSMDEERFDIFLKKYKPSKSDKCFKQER